MVGKVASRLTEDGSGIDISAGQIGTAAAIYVVGACLGALFFGQLTDRLRPQEAVPAHPRHLHRRDRGHRVRVRALVLLPRRFFTGAGIGGEYAAINSAIDELIPARVRGRVDLAINGSYWLGRRPARRLHCSSWTPRSSPRTSAGGWPSASARCSV